MDVRLEFTIFCIETKNMGNTSTTSVYKWLERLFLGFELLVHKYFMAPFRWLLTKVDPLSYKIEGTLFKKILQVTIYPFFMTLTFFIGFGLVEDGFTVRSFFGTIVMFIIFGIIFAPLEHLIPFSRKWVLCNSIPDTDDNPGLSCDKGK